MTNLAAVKLIHSIGSSLALDGGSGTVMSPLLESAASSFLIGKITFSAFFAKAEQPYNQNAVLFARAVELLSSPLPTLFNTDTLNRIHAKLYAEAPRCGTLRKSNIDLDNGSHTDYKYLKGSLKNVLARLQAVSGSPAISKADFTVQLAHYMQELNILSPFEQGNGFTRRTFFALFAAARGFDLNFSMAPKKEFEQAELLAFTADDPQLLFACLIKCVNYAPGLDIVPSEPAARIASNKPPRRITAKPIAKKPDRRRQKPTANNTRNQKTHDPYNQENVPVSVFRVSPASPRSDTAATTTHKSITPNTPSYTRFDREPLKYSDEELHRRIQSFQEKLAELSDELAEIMRQINK